MRACEHCGEAFEVGKMGPRSPRYCGRTCREYAYRERKRREEIAAAVARAVAADRARRGDSSTDGSPETRHPSIDESRPTARRGQWVMSGLGMMPLWVDEDQQQTDG